MNREALRKLGLTEEQIETVMAEHGKVITSTNNQVDTLTTERNDLRTQAQTYETQLKDLKKAAGDNEDLKLEIQRITDEKEQATNDLQEKLDKQAFSFALEKALVDAKAKNPKAVKALLDVDQIKLDGDKLLGLDTQIEALKTSDAYQFEEEKEEKGKLHGRNPNETKDSKSDGTVNPFLAETFNLTEQGRLFREDPEQYKLLKAQA